ncbi:long-chain fatty acid transporter [Legionella sainthelensi]|nr:long-chain fatty acid transporter [Legionella sainthelensi]
MHKPLRTLVSSAVIGVLATGVTHAAGFSLYGESAGYTTGNYAAGAAAEAADASTGWYNPAGLALLREQQMVFRRCRHISNVETEWNEYFYYGYWITGSFSSSH